MTYPTPSIAPVQPVCHLCLCGPATVISVRRNVGMILMRRWVSYRAPLCREHALKAVWDFTLLTMWQGWWGVISFYANIVALLFNTVALMKGLMLPRAQWALQPPVSPQFSWNPAVGAPTPVLIPLESAPPASAASTAAIAESATPASGEFGYFS